MGDKNEEGFCVQGLGAQNGYAQGFMATRPYLGKHAFSNSIRSCPLAHGI